MRTLPTLECRAPSRQLPGPCCSTTAGQGLPHRATSLHRPCKPQFSQQRCACRAAAAPKAAQTNGAAPATLEHPIQNKANQKGPKLLIAGAGIGGLVLAVALLKKGFEVQLFERDVTAIRGEGKYRGPIQIQSNALAALQAICPETAERILAKGCITGDRINGLCDGETGKWYVKFDTFHPAVEKGLPVTRVISRVVLQQLLAQAAMKMGGRDLIYNGAHVVGYEHKVDEFGKRRVWAILESGERYEGDILVGADGIWSKVRKQLVGDRKPSYSQYTCYTGIADFTPPDIDTVGYRVFLGNGRYFVSSDVGGGKMQWYGFHKEPAGGTDEEGKRKYRLLDIFGDWCDQVTDLIRATPEEDVLRRDIFDRPPVFRWAKGNVVLLGDSAHAMQPNLGQGGCMAIEDGFQLAKDLSRRNEEASGAWFDVEKILVQYQAKRIVRTSTIHGLAGAAAIMASTYKAYLGEGLGPLEQPLKQFKIPHPGRVGGYFAMNLTFPSVLGWVLGGNISNLRDSDRVPHCDLDEAPKGFHESEFRGFLKDDDALLRAANADWLLVPASVRPSVNADEEAEFDASMYRMESEEDHSEDVVNARAHFHGLRVARPEEALCIAEDGLVIGSGSDCSAKLSSDKVCAKHAEVKQSGGIFTVTDLGSVNGTWVNDRRIKPNQPSKILPGDLIHCGERSESHGYRVKMCHTTVEEQLARYLHDKSLLPSAGAASNSLGASNRELAGSTS